MIVLALFDVRKQQRVCMIGLDFAPVIVVNCLFIPGQCVLKLAAGIPSALLLFAVIQPSEKERPLK